MQRSRRVNPHTTTWEIPLAAVVVVVLLFILGVHAGRAGANLIAGAGLHFPPREELFVSVFPALGGDAGAGLVPRPDHVAGVTATRIWIGIVEVLNLALMLWASKIAWDRWGPSRVHGMATRTEAEKLLGRSRLRRNAAVIRPDLYGKRQR